MPTRYDARDDGIGDTVYTKGVETRYTTRLSSNGGYHDPERRATSRGYSSSDRFGTTDRSGTFERTDQRERQRYDQDEWERKTIVLEKASKDQSFGIAVSGGRDNPRFESGDTAIVVSDVLRGSPADGLLKIDDVILSVNKQSVEDETHAFAVKCLKDSGRSVKLCINRRIPGAKQTASREVVVKQTREGTDEIRYTGKQAPPYRSPPPHVQTEEYSYKVNDYPGQETHTRVITETREYVKPPEYRPPSHASEVQESPRNAPAHQSPREEVTKAAYKLARGDDEPILVKLERQNQTYGFSLGSQHFIQDVDQFGSAAREGSLEPGDVILQINGINAHELSGAAAINEVKSSKETLHLLVQKKNPLKSWVQAESLDGPALPPRLYQEQELTVTSKGKGEAHLPDDEIDGEKKLRTKNLYEKAMEAAEEAGTKEDLEVLNSFKPDKYEIEQTWRSPVESSNIPQEEVPLKVDQDISSSGQMKGYTASASDSPRSSRSGGGTVDRRDKKIRVGDGRLVTFKKEGSLGIQVAGGNQCGIFVAEVMKGSPAQEAGLSQGDQIIMANDVDFRNITREEAVLLLISLDSDVRLLVQHRRTAFEKIRNDPGDSFFVRCHIDYDAFDQEELSLKKGEILHVWDTMHKGIVGKWQAQLVPRSGADGKIGLVPNKNRATQLFGMAEKTKKANLGTGSMKRKSTLKKDSKKFISLDELDNNSFAEEEKSMNVPAYEKVNLKECSFMRPVVLLGPVADIARDRLLKEQPEKFALPEAIRDEGEKQQGGAPRRGISLSSIRAVIDAGKHCLLDVTPDAVDMINYAQLCPIVIYFKVPTVKAIRETRERLLGGKQPTKLIKRLHSTSQMLEKEYSYMFSTVIPVGQGSGWNQKVKDSITKLQSEEVWMSAYQVDEQEEMIFSQARRSLYSVSEFDSTVDSMAMDNSTIRSSTDEPYPEEAPPEPPVRDPLGPSYAPDDDVFTERSEDRWFEERDRHPEDQIDAKFQDDRDRDYGRRVPYDDRDQYDVRPPYDDYDREAEPFQRSTRHEDYIQGASMPGYKPTGNIVKVLPPVEKEMRASLRKTKPNEWSSDLESDLARATDSLRSTERVDKDIGPNELEMEIKQKATSLRRVEPESEWSKDYDDRLGVKGSTLWIIDQDYRRSAPQGYVQDRPQPPEYDDYRESSKVRNTVVDVRREDQEVVAEAKYMPTKSYATVTHYDPDTGGDKERTRYGVERETTTTYQRRYEPDPVRDYDSREGSLPQKPMEEVVKVTSTKEKESAPRYVSHFAFNRKSGRESPPERSAEFHSSYSGSLARPYGSSNARAEVPTRDTDYDYRYTTHQTTTTTTYQTKTAVNEPDKLEDLQNATASDLESCDEDHQVIATAEGTFGFEGGELTSEESGVSIVIPEGAIREGKWERIYFKVCKDTNFLPPLDADKGETLLSPLVMCGPHGLKFLKPVELRLPHCASMSPESWSFALKSSDAQAGEGHWQDMKLPEDKGCQVDSNRVSVLVDHFSWFGITGYPSQLSGWL